MARREGGLNSRRERGCRAVMPGDFYTPTHLAAELSFR
jgi:hypothetical protein